MARTVPASLRPREAGLTFQRQLGVPAVQLTDEGETYRTRVNDGKAVLVAPGWFWLTRLP